MKTIELSDQTAFKLYPTASTEMKIILEENWGKEFFKRKITDRVKTFEDACELTGEECNNEKFFTGTVDEIAYKKLKVIIRALNEVWTSDWNNSNQKKWYPWFYMNNPGFRFNFACYYFTCTHWGGGSRLCLKSEELATYAANQFLDLYKDLMVM